MSSNSQPQAYSQGIILKVLYTFDNTTTFLVRSTKTITTKVIHLPSQPPYNGATIGCIDIKKCVSLISEMSPECFQSSDYSIYAKDVIEPDEPFVGHGLYSKIIEKKSPVLVTGRICKNFVSLYTGGSNAADTLEVRLRFSLVNNNNKNSSNNSKSQPTATKSTAGSAAKVKKRKATTQVSSDESSPINPNSDDINNTTFQEPTVKKRSIVAGNNTSGSNLLINNLPQLATRTQSMPFLSENSLAHKIMLADMQEKEESDSRKDAIASRFSNFSKLMKNDDAPSRAKKYKSFASSALKAGDPQANFTVVAKGLKDASTQKCVNCSSTADHPYKFHREGIFEFGNSGLLCNICNDLQLKNDTKGLRARGELGSKGLLHGPYAKNILSAAATSNMNSVATTSTPAMMKSKKTNTIIKKATDEEMSSSPTSSSPLTVLPLNKNKMKRRNSSTTAIKTSSHLYNSVNNKPLITQESNLGNDLHELLNSGEVQNFLNVSNHDINDDLPGRHSSNQHALTDLDPIYHSKQANQRSSRQGSIIPRSHSMGLESSDSTNVGDESDEADDPPINAMKLNTTLIPFDDEDKENNPPFASAAVPSHSIVHEEDEGNENEPPLSLLVHEISPSIHRLIESFSNIEERGSPSKGSPQQWMNDLFTHEEEDEVESGGSGRFTRDDDAEINRVLKKKDGVSIEGLRTGSPLTLKFDKTPKDKFDVTPKDADTAQTQACFDTTETPRTFLNQIFNDNGGGHTTKTLDDVATNNNITVAMAWGNSNGAPAGTLASVAASKPTKRINMPSSPIFQTNIDEPSMISTIGGGKLHDNSDKDIETSRTEKSQMMSNWDATSSSPAATSDLSSRVNK